MSVWMRCSTGFPCQWADPGLGGTTKGKAGWPAAQRTVDSGDQGLVWLCANPQGGL